MAAKQSLSQRKKLSLHIKVNVKESHGREEDFALELTGRRATPCGGFL